MNGTVNKPRGVAFVGDVKDVCNEREMTKAEMLTALGEIYEII